VIKLRKLKGILNSNYFLSNYLAIGLHSLQLNRTINSIKSTRRLYYNQYRNQLQSVLKKDSICLIGFINKLMYQSKTVMFIRKKLIMF